MLSQYWLIVVFFSWTDKQQTSVSSACKSLRRLIFYFMQIPVRSQPFFVPPWKSLCGGNMGSGLSRPLSYSCYEVNHIFTNETKNTIYTNRNINSFSNTENKRDRYATWWWNLCMIFPFFLFTSGLDEVHWPQRQNWYCKLLRPIEFFQVAHTWTPHCSAGALDVGG